MENDEELEESQENSTEETDEERESSDEDKESSEKKPEEEEKPQEKPEPTPREKRLFARLQKEKAKRKELEKNRVGDTKSAPSGSEGKKSAEDEAKDYLRGLSKEVVKEVLEEQKKIEAEAKAKEDEEFQDLLDEFADLDPDFNEEKFAKLAQEFAPSNRDAAWRLWRKFKDVPLSQAMKEKPKMPVGKKTEGEEKSKLLTGKELRKPLHQIIEEAKKEHGLV